MKRLITALILPLLLLTACKSAEKFDPSDYTFPPEEVREMEWALDEAGLEGYKAEDARMTTHKVPDDIAIMRLTKDGCNTVVMVNMRLFGGVERQCGISFGYNQKPGDEEQLSAFVSDDYPLFWRLAGIALEAPEAVEKLQKDCAEYFTEPPEDTSQWKWSGSEGELSCTASYYFHPGFELWLPSEITLCSSSPRPSRKA